MPVLLNALGALGTLAFLTEMLRMFANRKKTKLEVKTLESTLNMQQQDQFLGVFQQVHDALKNQVSSQQERITYLEAQLDARDAKIEALSNRLTSLMDELAEMQTELRELRNQ